MRARRSGTWSPGPAAMAAAVAGTAATVAAVALFVAAVPALYRRHQTPSAAVATGLAELGLPLGVYAGFSTAVLVAFAASCVATGSIVVWRRSDEPVAWLVGAFLVLVGTVNAPTMEALAWQHPRITTAAAAANVALVGLLAAVLVTFPDGRAVPRVAAPLAVGAIAALAVLGWGRVGDQLPDAFFVTLLVIVVTGLAAQVYRYRRISTWEQRQQTKWVVVALGIAVTGQVVFPLLAALPALSRPGVGAVAGDVLALVGVTGGFAVLVGAFAVAILRHRLWDVDVVVNRTLVYGGLTLGVTIPYVLAVLAADRLVGRSAESLVSLVLAAAVALLLAQARQRLQRVVNRAMYGQRDEPYAVLSQLGRRIRDASEPAAVPATIVETLGAALRVPYVALVADGTEIAAVGTSQDGWGTVTIPLVHQDRRVGHLLVAHRGPDEPFNPADHALLDDLVRHIAAPVAAQRLADELQRAREGRIIALEEERRRLRRDLHDGLGPALASMILQAEVARDLLRCDPDHAAELLGDLTAQLHTSTSDLRRLVYNLRPPALDDLGLPAALRRYLDDVGSTPLVLRFTHPEPMPELPAAVEVAAYRIVQEAVTNVLRHAGATMCNVALALHGTSLTVTVEDDGVGLAAGCQHGVGLRSMQERAAELGGTCTITGSRDHGTRLQVHLPWGTGVGAVR